MAPTTIQVKTETLDRLKYFKEYSKESYDEIINKVIDEVEEGELTDEALKDIIEAKKEIREGKGQKIEDVAAELGIKL
jgi:predicted DNA-binding protein